jgi:uncharacterized protein with ParB-like and HNH nuclease domain
MSTIKEIPKSNTISISELVKSINRKETILQPDFQRKFVWTKKHMNDFIQTILDRYPFPEIYRSQVGIDLDTLESQSVIVDGQQRLTTIVRYIEGGYNFEKTVPKYKNLDNDQKQDFLSYPISVREMGKYTKDELIDIFQRINSTKFTLNSIEMNNAVYDGEFIKCANRVLDRIKDKEIKFEVFSENEITRMADLNFILLVMSTIEEGGYFTKDSAKIEEYISKFNELYENNNTIEVKLTNILIDVLTSELDVSSIWFRKSNFFTLIVEMFFADQKIVSILDKLKQLEENIMSNKNSDKEKNEFAKYYANMYVGTNSRQARVIRSEIFIKYILVS